MIVLGFALGWGAYALGSWGYFLIKGYDLSFKDVFSPSGYYKGAWPPAKAGNDSIFPSGTKSGELTTAGTTTSPVQAGLQTGLVQGIEDLAG